MEAFPLAIRVQNPSREAATHVWLILWKAFQAIGQNASRSVSELGLGQSDFAVLEVLMHKGPQPVNVIGRKVQLTSGSITAAVDRLESRKLLRRTADAKDGRSRIVQLTGKGRHLIERVPEGKNDWKPHEKSMPLGYLARLVADMPSWIAMAINQGELDLAPGGKPMPKPPE